jgi:ribosomal protein S18 acetylase RimI-like enzyme
MVEAFDYSVLSSDAAFECRAARRLLCEQCVRTLDASNRRLSLMLPNSLSYRRAGLADLPAIRDLAQAVHRLHYEALPHVFAAHPDRAGEEAHWSSSLQAEDGATFVACLDGAAVGFVTVRIQWQEHCLLQALTFARVGTLCVAEQMRGRGIGKALLEQAEDWAANCGAAEIRLEVQEFNAAARRLYEELGYGIRSFAMSKPIKGEAA